jgi:hypothetical protein
MAPNTTKEEMDKPNRLTIYGLVPTIEFQMVKCCADVIKIFTF